MIEEEHEADESEVSQAVACLIEISRRLRELSEEAAGLCRQPLDEKPTAH
jgi:hypothetical protein